MKTGGVTPDPVWLEGAPVISRFQMVVNDRVDLRKRIKGWNTQQFNDATWAKAKALKRESGWPLPPKNATAQPLTPPWTSLVPRDLPYLLEEQKAPKLIEARQIAIQDINPSGIAGRDTIILKNEIEGLIAQQFKSYQLGEKAMVIPPTKAKQAWFLLFDFGQAWNGTTQLDLEGPSGTTIDIITTPFIVDNQFTSRVVDSDFIDRLVLSGERDYWEATYFKPTRLLGLIIYNSSSNLKLHAASIRTIKYPFNDDGYVKAIEAPWIEEYVKASAKTINICTTDGYTDNYRERRQYAQTGYYAALGNYWTFGDHFLQRRYLLQVAQEQLANGIMPAYAPLAKDDYMVILDSNCLWLRSLHNYFLYSGDSITVRRLLPSARKLLELLHSFTNKYGLIDNPPYPYWLDHAQNDRRGANFCLNGHYLGALEDFTTVLKWLEEEDYSIYQNRSELLRQSLRTKLWNEDLGLFMDARIDGTLSKQTSEHANAMALALEIADSKQAQLVAQALLMKDDHNFIRRKSGMTMVTPAMSYFLHKGLCNYGYVDESFQMLQERFNHMLTSPNSNGTLWEEWWLTGSGRSGKFQGGKTRSDAQTESAFPPALFGEFLLGVRPTKPGLKEILITRPTTSLSQLEGVLPTPYGNLFIRWNFDKSKGGQLQLEVPENMSVKLDLESINLEILDALTLNGQQVSFNLKESPFLLLEKGKHQIEF